MKLLIISNVPSVDPPSEMSISKSLLKLNCSRITLMAPKINFSSFIIGMITEIDWLQSNNIIFQIGQYFDFKTKLSRIESLIIRTKIICPNIISCRAPILNRFASIFRTLY